MAQDFEKHQARVILEPTVFLLASEAGWLRETSSLLGSLGAGFQVEMHRSLSEFIRDWLPDRPGCLLLDSSASTRDSDASEERLWRLSEALPVIFLTERASVPWAVRAMTARAVTFIEMPTDAHKLPDAVKTAFERDASVREQRARRNAVMDCIASLTPRERQVMHLVVAGESNKGVAAKLGISFRTIEIHRARVMEKMKATSLSGLVRTVLMCGL